MSARETLGHTLKVAFAVCLVCAVVVATAAVGLRPAQERNRLQFRQQIILDTAGLPTSGAAAQAALARIERRFVDLASGDYVERGEGFDPRRAARDPAQSRLVDPDPASIRRQALVAEVYLVRDEAGRLQRLILPVYGYGLWSTMHGFVALERDLATLAGIRFYEHGETPGLGGEIENPRWQAGWPGKQLYDDAGEYALAVVKGRADAGDPHRIDGLTGATLTTRGVDNLMRFWLGEQGFAPYLAGLRQRLDAGREE